MPKSDWRDIGNVKARRAARQAQEARDAAWRASHQPMTNYTVTNSDNIQTIADKYNLDPQHLLSLNPQLNTLQTGMVIDVPNYDTPAQRYLAAQAFKAKRNPPLPPSVPRSHVMSNGFVYDPTLPDWKPLFPIPGFDNFSYAPPQAWPLWILGGRINNWQASSPFVYKILTSGPWKNAGGYNKP